MEANYRQLLEHCTELLATYRGDLLSFEDHLNDYLQSKKIIDEGDVTFLSEVFVGCLRQKEVLQVVTDSFYLADGRNVLRSKQELITILTYLALFRLDELGLFHFRKFLDVLDTHSAYKFCGWLFDDKKIQTWANDGWNRIYESSYVQANIAAPILRWLPELKGILDILRSKLNNTQKLKKIAIPNTDPVPFNLTKPKARAVPIPEKIPKLKKSNPVPKSLYRTPQVQDVLEKTREENKRKAEESLAEASRRQFACANPEKSDKTKQSMQRIIQETQAELEAGRIKAKPLPDFSRPHLPVKMTAAAILREAQLIQKEEKEVIEKLRKLEAGESIAADFYKWQSEQRQQDLECQLAAIEERKLLGKLSHEAAILARTNLMQENQVKAQNLKKELGETMQNYLELKAEREKELKMQVENIMAGHKNVSEVKKVLTEQKQKLVQEMKEESKDLLRQAQEEAEAEMLCRMELIQQIRAMEATPISQVKLVDLASTPGLGLFGEMSIVELRERLALLKARAKEEEAMRRESISNIKQARAEQLSEAVNLITKYRSERSKYATCRIEQQKVRRGPPTPYRNDNLLELERRIQETRKERLKEQQKFQIRSKVLTRPKSLISPKVWNTFYQCDEEQVIQI